MCVEFIYLVPSETCWKHGGSSLIQKVPQKNIWVWISRSNLKLLLDCATVDGRYPAPVDMENLTLFRGFQTCQVVQDFFYQQYLYFRQHPRLFVDLLFTSQ